MMRSVCDNERKIKRKKGHRMGKSEVWRACELLVLKSERELFWKRKILSPSFSILESELWACFINFNYFQSLLSINEILKKWACDPKTIRIPSLRASKKKECEPRHFNAELFELQQTLPSFAFSNRPFYTPKNHGGKLYYYANNITSCKVSQLVKF